MKILFGDAVGKNISFQVLLSLAVVVLTIGAVDFIFLVLSELSDISNTYKFVDVLIYCVSKVPYSLYDLSPYLCLIGVMVGLGNLNDQGELVASKILGKSNLKILLSSFRPVLLFLFLGLIASEFWLPGLSQKAEENRLLKQEIINSDQGYWIANEEGFSYFRSTPSNNLIEDVTIYSINSEFELFEIQKASRAKLVSGSWILGNVETENLTEGLIQVDEESVWQTGPQESDFNLILSPKYFPLSLLRQQMSNDVSEYRRNLLALEFWRKLLQPLVAFVLILLAASFIFGPMRDQKSGQRVIAGIVLAFSVNIIKSLFESVSMVSNMSPFVAVITPIGLILLVGLFLIKKTKVIS